MRIIAGDWRGRKLAEPKGRETTRPTTDRTREACASMVDSALPGGIEGCRMLDAFAGSGAMGIELLSRGAGHVSFFDIDRGAAQLVKKNLETVGCDRSRYTVTAGDVFAIAARGRILGAPFDVVFLDPPYALEAEQVARLVEDLAEGGNLAEGAVVLYEHAAKDKGMEAASFEVVREKRYGTTGVDLLQLRGERFER